MEMHRSALPFSQTYQKNWDVSMTCQDGMTALCPNRIRKRNAALRGRVAANGGSGPRAREPGWEKVEGR